MGQLVTRATEETQFVNTSNWICDMDAGRVSDGHRKLSVSLNSADLSIPHRYMGPAGGGQELHLIAHTHSIYRKGKSVADRVIHFAARASS
jgi:hypothetical protein